MPFNAWDIFIKNVQYGEDGVKVIVPSVQLFKYSKCIISCGITLLLFVVTNGFSKIEIVQGSFGMRISLLFLIINCVQLVLTRISFWQIKRNIVRNTVWIF